MRKLPDTNKLDEANNDCHIDITNPAVMVTQMHAAIWMHEMVNSWLSGDDFDVDKDGELVDDFKNDAEHLVHVDWKDAQVREVVSSIPSWSHASFCYIVLRLISWSAWYFLQNLKSHVFTF